MKRNLTSACFLTTSIEFLTPEPRLFKKNLCSHEAIECDIYNIDRPFVFREFQDKTAKYDIFIVDTWVTLLDSQFNTGNFRETHLYRHVFKEGQIQLNIFRQWLISFMQRNLKDKLFILYAGTFDYWRITENDRKLLVFLNSMPNFILWAPNPKLSNAEKFTNPYKNIVLEACNEKKYLEIRHAIDIDYDVCGKDINKIFEIGVLPSLSKERISLYKSIEHMMCTESRKLYRKSILLLQKYKLRLAKFNESNSLSEVDIILSEQRELNLIYRRILSFSQIICTTPTRYGAFIRKYLEVPYAKGMIATPSYCGWEDNLFRTIKYPLISTKTNAEGVNKKDLLEKYLEHEDLLAKIQSNIYHHISYKARIDEMISFCLKY